MSMARIVLIVQVIVVIVVRHLVHQRVGRLMGVGERVVIQMEGCQVHRL